MKNNEVFNWRYLTYEDVVNRFDKNRPYYHRYADYPTNVTMELDEDENGPYFIMGDGTKLQLGNKDAQDRSIKE